MALTRVNFAGQGQNVLQSSSMPTGTVLQTLSMNSNVNTAHQSLSYTDTNLTLAITPSATSSKILVIPSFSVRAYHTSYNSWGRIALYRGSTLVCTRDVNTDGGNNVRWATVPSGFTHLDSPSTTSATTYLIKCKLLYTNYSAQIDIGEFKDESTNDETNQQSFTLMEIKG